MKKSLLFQCLIAILIVLSVAFVAVGCKDTGGSDVGGSGTSDNAQVSKDALNAEIALEIKEQGDYTLDSFNAYVERLNEARAVSSDAEATQFDVDKAENALKKARLALTVRPVEAVKDANKEIYIVSGASQEINIADYVNTNGLTKITYKALSSNEILALSEVANGKLTLTAGEVIGEEAVKVSINVYYDNSAKLAVSFTVKIKNDVAPTLVGEEISKEYDLVKLEDKEKLVIDLAENINNIGNLPLTYTVKCGDVEDTLDGTTYTIALDSYTEVAVYKEFTVTVSYTVNGVPGSLEYTYKLGIKDTGKYSIANGGFENGLDGWTLVTVPGYEAPFGGIDNKTHYWVQEFPMFNVGSYFSAYADGASEASQGTLASSYFIVNSEYATYMLGGAGNERVYITIEDKNGEVLALYRNTMFADLPAGVDDYNAQRELVGKTVFLANFVTYKVDLSGFMGKEVRFVVHDGASKNWGVVFFDELNTYYASSDSVPENAVLAENLLADKAALEAELSLEITEQGDYTKDSYDFYVLMLEASKVVLGDAAAPQEVVDIATASLKEARQALEIRAIEEIAGVQKSFRLTTGAYKEITLSDYININGLSKITYEIVPSGEAVTVTQAIDGKFTVIAGEVVGATEITVRVIVYYNGAKKLETQLTVLVTNDLAPTVLNKEAVKEYDLYELENKSSISLDLSENVDNVGNLELTYSVSGNKLNGTLYTFNFGSYTDKVTNEVITVTITYTANGSQSTLEYTYKLAIKDTTAYRLVNGGFENGLDAWDKVGNIGDISSDSSYWVEEWENDGKGYLFGMDGEYMFSAYAEGALESAVGTLTSSKFTVGGSGFVTFKLGAAKDGNYVYVDVIDADTKEILARYYNGLWAETTDGLKSGCTLIAYKADLSKFSGREVYFRISDNADSGYGLFFVDSFVTYYESEPDGFNAATPVNYEVSGTIYDVFNGGFEMGDVQGWWNNGTPGHVTNADAFFSGVAYGKDGNFLYSGVEDFEAGNGLEGNRGVLTSSVFEIGGTGYISFMLGGGGNSLCYVQVIDSTTGEILARYRQQAMQDAVLVTYVADLSAYIGRSARIQVVDQAVNNWGCVSFDNVVTYYASKDELPSGLTAEDIKASINYNIENGSFETGNIDGWTMDITEAGTHNTLGWVLETEMDAGWYAKNDETKDGKYLFTFAQPGDINCENTKGTLTSSTFTLKQGAFVSFKFGAAGNASNHDVYIELCRADGTVIARFYNDAEGKVNTRMNAYYYQYTDTEVECFFRAVDNSTGDYGCLVLDDFKVNLESAPEGYIPAIQ